MMSKRILLYFMIFMLAVGFCFSATNEEDIDFQKGIAYFLIKDIPMAKKYLNTSFKKANIHPAVRAGFTALFDGNNTEATDNFKSFLEINNRSSMATLGIALSTSDMKVTNTQELLKRILQLSPGYAPARLVLGMDFLRKKNYPESEFYLKQAVAGTNIPEYKIILGMLYLELGKPELTLSLMKNEADRTPDNFYFNLLTGRAYYKLNNLSDMSAYIESALGIYPNNAEAKMMMARYYISSNNIQKAKLILNGIKFNEYNEEYAKIMAEALLKLRDAKAKSYLYEIFDHNKWDPEINTFLGLYHKWFSKGTNVQNWINRALLSGVSGDVLKTQFSGNFQFPVYNAVPLFDVSRIEWITGELVLTVATRVSGESEKIIMIDPKTMRITNAFAYSGKLLDICFSRNRKNAVIVTAAEHEKSIYLYAASFSRNAASFQQIFGSALPMPGAVVGFTPNESQVYITDQRISTVALESPFSVPYRMGQSKCIYPDYFLPIYIYNFTTRSFRELKDKSQLNTVPIAGVRQYAAVANAALLHAPIQELIDRGRQLDLTANESVRIFFSNDLSSFIIYLFDLKNAFSGFICDSTNNQVMHIDSEIILGKGNFSELLAFDFNPFKREILMEIKNDARDIVSYNYKSRLVTYLTSAAYKYYFDNAGKMIYSLLLRSNKNNYLQTELAVITLHPFGIQRVTNQPGLSSFVNSSTGEPGTVTFNTIDGEMVQMDNCFKFSYLKPSLEGSVHSILPGTQTAATFINGRLIILN